MPSDGYADPSQLTQSFASGARAAGVQIVQNCRVTAVERVGRRVTAVVTEQGRIECDTVVNATGMWGAETAELAGVSVAVSAVEHQYVVTEQSADIPHDLPTLRDPDARIYLKPENGALVLGGWEDGTRAPWRTHPPRPRPGALRAQPRTVRTARRGCGTTDPALRRDRDPELDQRPDPLLPRRRATDGGHRGPGQPLSLLRLLGRDRGGRWRGLRDGQLDHRRRPRSGPVAVRRPPVRPVAQRAGLSAGSLGRRLRALLRHRLPQSRAGRPARSAAQPALRRTGRCGRGAGHQVRVGAPELVRPRGGGPGRAADLRAQQRLRPRRRRACGRAHGGRRGRPELVREVRDLRRGRARPGAAGRGGQPGRRGRQGRLHPAAQRGRRDRGRRHDHPAARGPLLLRDGERVRPPRRDLPAPARADRRQRHDPRGDVGLRGAQRLRPARPARSCNPCAGAT